MIDSVMYVFRRTDCSGVELVKYNEEFKDWDLVFCCLAPELSGVINITVYSNGKQAIVKVRHNVPAAINTWYRCYVNSVEMVHDVLVVPFSIINEEKVYYNKEDRETYIFDGEDDFFNANSNIYKIHDDSCLLVTTSVSQKDLDLMRKSKENLYNSSLYTYREYKNMKDLNRNVGELYLYTVTD